MDPEAVNIVLGLGGIVVGIVVSYIFYRLSIQRKEPRWVIIGNNLISDFGSEWERLAITYDQRAVKDLSVSKLALWNAGRTTIESADLTAIEPLRISLPQGTDLLDARLLTQNNQASCCAIAPDYQEGIVTLSFDYLDQGNGFVVQVVHTGVSATDLEVKGAVKGVSRLKRSSRISPISLEDGYLNTIYVLGGLVAALAFAWTLWSISDGNALPDFGRPAPGEGRSIPTDPRLYFFVVGILAVGVAAGLIGGFIQHYLPQRTYAIPPMELRKFLK